MYSAHMKNYKRIEVESASPGKLLLMLYDGTIEFLKLAQEHLESGNKSEFKHYIGKSQAIITELMSTINTDAGEIAYNLMSLYEFMLSTLIEAYGSGSAAHVGVVVQLLSGLRESWDIVINKNGAVPVDEEPVGDTVQSVAGEYKQQEVKKGINITG